MNLKKTALLAEVVGGVGIIISILYLAFEVSESARNAQMSNHLALIELASEFKYLRMTSPDMAEIVLRGSSDAASLSEADQIRFRSYVVQALDIWETAFLMNENDVLPAGAWDVWDNAWCNTLKEPGYRAVWDAGSSEYYISRFRDKVDACFAN